MNRRNKILLGLLVLSLIGCTVWSIWAIVNKHEYYAEIIASIYIISTPAMLFYVFRLCAKAPINYRILIIWCCEIIFLIGFLLAPILAILYFREELYLYLDKRRTRQ